jgi:hypothetical protein
MYKVYPGGLLGRRTDQVPTFFLDGNEKNVLTWALLTKKAPKGPWSGGRLMSRGFVPFLQTFVAANESAVVKCETAIFPVLYLTFLYI